MDDLARLRTEYEDRERRLSGRDLYSWFNTANLFTLQGRQRAVLRVLKNLGRSNLANLRILEMGCGGGGVLSEFLCYGAAPHNLYGLDLLSDRLRHAREHLPGMHFLQANGSRIPFPEGSFGLVLQFTAISSILDPELRRDICTDMLRVLQPDGMILSYDFWLNPTNPQARGLHLGEIKKLFPGCRITAQRITLAPPIARRLASFAWGLCTFLEGLKIFNTHYLAAIRREV